jgi:geranylgeranyl diphosphate synthase type II
VVQAAVAVELLHYAFVLHDDVIDGDLVRRGRPNLVAAVAAEHPQHGSQAAAHWGNTAAILMGDLFLSGVYQTIARLDVGPEARERLFAIVDHTIGETVAGEFVDVGLADGAIAPELATIVDMSANKTSAYSFELPLRAAAVLTGVGRAAEDELAAVGRHVGLAFQLQDDLLSVFGDPARHGKDPHSDLREGKETALMAYARMTHAWVDIEPHIGRDDLSDRDAATVRALLEECGARRFVEGLVDDSLGAFRDGCGDPGRVSPRMAEVLLTVADALEERQS